MMNNIELKIVATDEEYAQTMQVRRKVFVEEQKISPEKEFDGNDHSSTHVLALDGGEPVGTMRIRYFNGFVKFERMCVLPSYRKTDVSAQIMKKGMIFSAEKGYEKVYGVCKKELLSRWNREGFSIIEDAPLVEQNGMTLVPVYCPLPKVQNPITMKTPAEVLNAKEGEWEKVLQRTERENFQQNLDQMLARVRLFRKTEKVKIDPNTIKYVSESLSR